MAISGGDAWAESKDPDLVLDTARCVERERSVLLCSRRKDEPNVDALRRREPDVLDNRRSGASVEIDDGNRLLRSIGGGVELNTVAAVYRDEVSSQAGRAGLVGASHESDWQCSNRRLPRGSIYHKYARR